MDQQAVLQSRAHLMETSEEFRRLAAEHSSTDRRVEELSSRVYLTPEEQEEEARLKVLKLRLKDQMELMVLDAQTAVH